MDGKAFDRATRQLTARFSRRTIWPSAAGAALAAAASRLPIAAGAKQRRGKKKQKKLKLNAFGCVDVGGTCRGNSAKCCSGVCQGKKPKKGEKDRSTCVAHNVGECQAGQDSCLGNAVQCGDDGLCSRTTGNASFCGFGGECFDCKKDRDCEANFGPGAACVVCFAQCGQSLTACIVPRA